MSYITPHISCVLHDILGYRRISLGNGRLLMLIAALKINEQYYATLYN